MEEEISKSQSPPELSLTDALLEVEEDRTELDKIFEQMLAPENLKHLTDLRTNEIAAFAAIAPIARKYHLDLLKEIVVENLTLRISGGRGGRKEWTKILSKQLDKSDEEASRLQKLMGRGNRP